MFMKTGLLLVIICFSAILQNTADAAIFKCVGADGVVSYNQTPCPVEEETTQIMSNASASKDSFDCRIANNFARQTAMGMRAGQSSGDTFASYGGIDAIPRTAIGVINYVYTHIGNVDTGPQRIAALSAARCSAGSYGPVGCDDFPYRFIAELGGCETATQSTLTPPKPLAATADTNDAAVQSAGNQAMGVRTANEKPTSSVDCKDSVQTQLSALFSKMRAGQSASSQGKLKQQKLDLQAQLSDCQ